jgi:hypothetical protein
MNHRTIRFAQPAVALALLAISAYPSTLGSFVLDSQTISTIHNSGGGPGNFVPLATFSTASLGVINSFEGLSIFGSVGVTCSYQGGSACNANTIDYRFTGHVTGGMPPPTADVAYDWTTDVNFPAVHIYYWSLLGQSGSARYRLDNVTGSSTMSIAGSNWSMDLQITLIALNAGDIFSLKLPIDISAPAPIPEPSSIALTLAGAATIFLLRRKRAQ